MKRILIILFCVGALALSGAALAQRGGRKGPPPKPPAEAIEACQGKASGDRCSFKSPHGEVEGTCWAPREELPLACRPARRPRGR